MISVNRPIVEILTPKLSEDTSGADAKLDRMLGRFKEKYVAARDSGYYASIPDNPMGELRFTAIETLEFLDLEAGEDFLLHVNTFHPKQELDTLLKAAIEKGIRNVLCVSGDGNPKKPRLEPEDLGITATTVTSVQLIEYILREFPDAFDLGAAFNQYEPKAMEHEKLSRKLEAGAKFLITQPCIGSADFAKELGRFHVPVFVGLWFSKNVSLLADCVGNPIDESAFEPFTQAERVVAETRGCGYYLSLLKREEVTRAGAIATKHISAQTASKGDAT